MRGQGQGKTHIPQQIAAYTKLWPLLKSPNLYCSARYNDNRG
jgi:hypothetical protein